MNKIRLALYMVKNDVMNRKMISILVLYYQIPVAKYSMGMKQRLGIAQAVMEEQELLLLDEPFNGLDDKGVGEMRRLFLQMKPEKIILLTSHNREDLEALCDEIYRLELGKLKRIV